MWEPPCLPLRPHPWGNPHDLCKSIKNPSDAWAPIIPCSASFPWVLSFPLGFKVRHPRASLMFPNSNPSPVLFKNTSWTCSFFPSPPQSRFFLPHLLCWLGLFGVLPPQSMYGLQIHLPRPRLPTHHFPVQKSLMIPHHLEDNLAWHFKSVSTYLLCSYTHEYFLTPPCSLAGCFRNVGTSSVLPLPDDTLSYLF